jgi:hypothetical protein
MANETTFAALADSTQRETLTGTYEMLLADRNALPNHPALLQMPRANGLGSTTMRLPLLGVDGYDELAATNDGADVAATVITDEKIEVTIARYSKRYRPTDLARLVNADGSLSPQRWAQDAFVSNITKLTDLVANVVGTFTDTVGLSGTNLDIETLLAAKTALEIRNVPGPYLCKLHPQQFADIRLELATVSGGAVQWSPASQEMINVMGSGYVGNFAGIDIFVTSRVPTANAGADYAGGMFGRTGIAWGDGQPFVDDPAKQIAIPHGLFELDRDAKAGVTEWVTHAYLGVSKGNDDAGVAIITDA